MEQHTHAHPSTPSSPVAYVTAPNSPIDLDEFEFGTCMNLSGHLHFDDPREADLLGQVRHRDRGDSLPAMAFADELFLNGLVMPLKLPPRLQQEGSESSGLKSPLLSPRTICRLPFARRMSSWNDDFDPFTVALEKVREENRGRNSHHRWSRSYSPFRRASRNSNVGSSDHNKNLDLHEEEDTITKPMEVLKVLAPSRSGPLDFKGSAYARWVLDQTREGISPKVSPRSFLLGKKVRPMKEQDSPDNPGSPEGKPGKNSSEEHYNKKVGRLKGLFQLKFVRGKNGMKKQAKAASEAGKPGYFGRVVSFKSKGKKTMATGSNSANMAVVEYKPSSLKLCLGRGVGVLGSPAAAAPKPK